MQFEIRPPRPQDEAAWRGLWRAYLAFYGVEVAPEIYATTFARILDDGAPEMAAFLAVADEPVGLVHYLFHRNFWTREDSCYLQDLFVDPNRRTRGAGRALIEAVYAAADRNGAPFIYWMTQDFNMPARHLYEHVGRRTSFLTYTR